MILKLKLKQGFIQEINVEEIIEIDGRSFEGVRSIDVGNHEDRIQILERLVKNLCDFCDTFTSERNQENPDSELGDLLKPVPSMCEVPN